MITSTDIVEAAVAKFATTEQLIATSPKHFVAKRGEKFIHAGGKGMRVHTSGERVIHLPNGATVKVTTDDSGRATQIEEDEHLHAVARPPTYVHKTRS